MKNLLSISIGYICIIAWAVISAYARVAVGDVDQRIDPFALCLYVFAFAALFFLITNVRHLKKTVMKCRRHLGLFVLINISTAGVWLSLFYPLKYADPSIVSAINLGLTPMMTLFLTTFFFKSFHQKASRIDGVLSLAMLTAVLYLVFLNSMGLTATTPLSIHHNIMVTVCFVITGFAIALNLLTMKKLTQAGFKPSETMTVRYPLLLIVTLTVMFFQHHLTLPQPQIWPTIGIVALVTAIIPLWCFVTGVSKIEPISVAMLMPLLPICVYVLELFDARLRPNKWVVMGIVLVAVLTMIAAVVRYRTDTRQKNSSQLGLSGVER